MRTFASGVNADENVRILIQIFIYTPGVWEREEKGGVEAKNRLNGIERNVMRGHAGPNRVVGVRWAHPYSHRLPFTRC